MSDMTSISDEILQQAETFIKELLKNKRLRQTERAQLEIQSYFLMFLVHNHQRMSEVYPFYKKQKEAQEKWEAWWNRLQWVIIPMVVGTVFVFLGQAVYFWMVVVPDLMAK
jgi:hypothetical protein